jgi:hypothetical protein
MKKSPELQNPNSTTVKINTTPKSTSPIGGCRVYSGNSGGTRK